MTGVPQPLIRVQDHLVRLLGNSVEGRGPLVAAMLHRNAREATTYWLQLIVSIGIATLGLVVGSSAVVIGAMLVAPLMGPIVGLAMGLATGSPFLVLRSAALLRFLMPFVLLAGVYSVAPRPRRSLRIGRLAMPPAARDRGGQRGARPVGRIRVVHLGPALSADGNEVLGRALEAELEERVRLSDAQVSPS